ncbi:MAG: hypothetical protein AB7V32_06950 [Candidatus Berkiella sp.]
MKGGMKTSSNPVKSTGLFAQTVITLFDLLESLETKKQGQAQAGIQALDVLIKEFSLLVEHFKTGQLFLKDDISKFKNAIAITAKIWNEHVTGGWHMYVSHEEAIKFYNGYLERHNNIIELLNQMRMICKINAKLFSDMIVHFRLFKSMVNFHLLNAKISLIKSNDDLPEILRILNNLEMEHNYLLSKIPLMDKSNQRFDGYVGMLYQCYFGMLNHKAKISIPDNSGKSVELINPKNLLRTIKDLSAQDGRNFVQTLPLCIVMAERILSKEKLQATISQLLKNNIVYRLNKNDFDFAWQFLACFLENIDTTITLRGAVNNNIAIALMSNKKKARSVVGLLFVALKTRIQQNCELDELMLYFNIINKMYAHKECKPDNLNDAFIQDLQHSVNEKKADKIAQLTLIVSHHEEVHLKKEPYPHFVIALNQNLKVRLDEEVKNQRCKLKYTVNNHCLVTQDLFHASKTDIESLLRICTQLKRDAKQEQSANQALIEDLEQLQISSGEQSSGRKFLKDNPPPPERVKTRGAVQIDMQPDLKAADNLSDSPKKLKFAKLFGEDHKHKNIKRCRMQNSMVSFYVCLEDSLQADDCSIEVRGKFEKLFDVPKQARKKGDTGFKLTDTQHNGDITLCAKVLGIGGNKRAYPYQKVVGSDNRSILFLYRNIVSKESQAEKNHVVQTQSVRQGFLPQQTPKPAPKKPHRTKSQKGKNTKK